MIYDQKQSLLNNSRDKLKIEIIRSKLGLPRGGLYQGCLPKHKWAQENIGQTYSKTILASKGIESMKFGTYTALGGWCSLRTKCVNDLSKGILTDPKTGLIQKYKNVDEVVQWLSNAISADQIVESIGLYNGTSYAAISEERLWSEKVIRIMQKYFSRKLLSFEKDKIRLSIRISDDKRYQITKKYIEIVQNKKINLTKIIDNDIFSDLVKSRDKILRDFNISLMDLGKRLITNRGLLKNKNDDEKKAIQEDLHFYINNYSIVMLMYTGYYLEILKENNYIKTPKAIVIEPYPHIQSNEFEGEFKGMVFSSNQGKNNYHVEGGINENIGFIAIDDVSTYACKRIKLIKSISEVPNIKNYNKFIDSLSFDKNVSILDLRNNPVFMLGINYLPYGKCRKALLEMIEIRNEYLIRKSKIKYYHENESFYEITELKKNKSLQIHKQALIVLDELDKLFSRIFSI